MAGADRVEGCLFGNGERTGNVCLVTLALNLFTQGIDPEVRYSRLTETVEIAEYCTELKVPERYPWAGNLVYTAFSGSHQDAIKKGLEACSGQQLWEVPYLPLDPQDVGFEYKSIIRVNSQSGKGGIAYLLEVEYGIALPKDAQAEFAQVVQKVTDTAGREITANEIYSNFLATYIDTKEPFSLEGYEMSMKSESCVTIKAQVRAGGKLKEVVGEGNGPVSAFVTGLNTTLFGSQEVTFTLSDYHSVARSKCKAAQSSEAVATVRCQAMTAGGKQGSARFGVGLHGNTTTAVLRAVISALNCIVASGETKLFQA